MNCEAYQRCHVLRLCEFGVLVLRRVTFLEGGTWFSFPCRLFFASKTFGSNNGGRTFPCTTAPPPPPNHPYIPLYYWKAVQL